MPKAFPKEFREDVIRVYRNSDASVAQVAKDFGVSPTCVLPPAAGRRPASSDIPA
jgi:transposase